MSCVRVEINFSFLNDRFGSVADHFLDSNRTAASGCKADVQQPLSEGHNLNVCFRRKRTIRTQEIGQNDRQQSAKSSHPKEIAGRNQPNTEYHQFGSGILKCESPPDHLVTVRGPPFPKFQITVLFESGERNTHR